MNVSASRVDNSDVSVHSPFRAYPVELAREIGSRVHELERGPDDPIVTVQRALAAWNQYVRTPKSQCLEAFLVEARWLLRHERDIGNGASGWPIRLRNRDARASSSALSAVAQGGGISVLVRAYYVDGDNEVLDVLARVIKTFSQDILDGGITAPIGDAGIFFEEVAVYPAAHTLRGFAFALLGLYDYLALTGDPQIDQLISRSLATMHRVADEFDAGYWTYLDLLDKRLASPRDLPLQCALVEALGTYSGCAHCLALARRWKTFRHSVRSRWRYLRGLAWQAGTTSLVGKIRKVFHATGAATGPMPVCIALPSFPSLGGVQTVVEGIAEVMRDVWRIEYLTQYAKPGPVPFIMHRFGTARMSPWNFPQVWSYVMAGLVKVLSLMRQGAGYRVILPQDGIYTAAFAALAAKLTGARTVCIDHGDISLLSGRNKAVYRSERIRLYTEKPWPWLVRCLYGVCLVFYFPSRSLLARVSARLIDYFLIPGVEGDGIEHALKDLGVGASRIRRYASMIDVDRHVVVSAATRNARRLELGIPADAMVVASICRLSPEKGLDVALESISTALRFLASDVRARVRWMIVGDGPIRDQLGADVRARQLDQTCLLWGEASTTEVLSILSVSDIFLYTSTRGACFAMAILEAMASGCAVIASTEPISNAQLLADGRGVAVPASDVEGMSKALVRLLGDGALCTRMGQRARGYVAANHSPDSFRRALLQATYWCDLDDLLKSEAGEESQRRPRQSGDMTCIAG